MNRSASIWLGLLAIALLPTLAQMPTGRIHGQVINPTGNPQGGGTVSLSTDGGKTSEFTYGVAMDGTFGGDAAPGTYQMIYRADNTPRGQMVDSVKAVTVSAGETLTQNIDMSRQEFVDKMSVGQREQLEELKRRNSEAMKTNAVINRLNADLKIVSQDFKDGDSASDAEIKAAKYGEAEALLLSDTEAKPDASILWVQLGQAQVGLMKYREAESSFTKALEVESASTRPNPQIQNLANTKLAQIHAMAGVSAKTNVAPPVPNQPAQESAPPASAQHQYQDIAPPPPPPAPAPTISMGQSKSQVIAAFGEPQRKAAAGPKEIFFYTDLKMKVTFTNGKVSSIE